MSNHSTLKKLFENGCYTKIVVPLIQRHYAQGRMDIDSTRVRQDIVRNIYDALQHRKTINLQFIYGSKNGNTFELLDGQQRLTTLFLFHWYLYVREGDENTRVPDYMQKFEYRTRSTSTDFCNRITTLEEGDCKKIRDSIRKGKSPSDILRNQPWYSYAHECDDTVRGMLVMLDEIHNGYGESSGLHENLERIEFSIEDIGDYPDKEDLYTKMNARGLILTDFENFKADIIDHLKNTVGEVNWLEMLEQWFDEDFTGFFWNVARNKKEKTEIPAPDPLMMEFINRFAGIRYILLPPQDEDRPEAPKTEKIGEESIKKFPLHFTSFGPYERIFETGIADLVYLVEFIKCAIDKSKSCEGGNTNEDAIEDRERCAWGPGLAKDATGWEPAPEEKIIPAFINNDGSTWKGRCILAAILIYVQRLTKLFGSEQNNTLGKNLPAIELLLRDLGGKTNNDQDKTNGTKFETWLEEKWEGFRRWMRVCWNIAENTHVSSPERMVSCIRLLDKLAAEIKLGESGDIYERLGNASNFIEKSIAPRRHRVLQEEIEKAKVFNEREGTDGALKYQKDILEAEKRFKGGIFFLFTDRNDGPERVDWTSVKWGNDFMERKERAFKLLGKDTENENMKTNWINFMYQLLANDEMSQLVVGNPLFEFEKWLSLVKNPCYLVPLSKTLKRREDIVGDNFDSIRWEDNPPFNQLLRHIPLIKTIIERESKARLVTSYWGQKTLFKRHCRTDRDKLVLGPLASTRCETLNDDARVDVEAQRKVKDNVNRLCYLWGLTIDFTYCKNTNCSWYILENRIYGRGKNRYEILDWVQFKYRKEKNIVLNVEKDILDDIKELLEPLWERQTSTPDTPQS